MFSICINMCSLEKIPSDRMLCTFFKCIWWMYTFQWRTIWFIAVIILHNNVLQVLYKIIDLGYAKELFDSSILYSFVGTMQYLVNMQLLSISILILHYIYIMRVFPLVLLPTRCNYLLSFLCGFLLSEKVFWILT